jgi:hypothetical protein
VARCAVCERQLKPQTFEEVLASFTLEEMMVDGVKCTYKPYIRDSHGWARCSHGNILGSCHDC